MYNDFDSETINIYPNFNSDDVDYEPDHEARYRCMPLIPDGSYEYTVASNFIGKPITLEVSKILDMAAYVSISRILPQMQPRLAVNGKNSIGVSYST